MANDNSFAPPQQTQDARETAAFRTQMSVDHDPERLRTDEQKDAAYKDITGEARPGSEARQMRQRSYGGTKKIGDGW